MNKKASEKQRVSLHSDVGQKAKTHGLSKPRPTNAKKATQANGLAKQSPRKTNDQKAVNGAKSAKGKENNVCQRKSSQKCSSTTLAHSSQAAVSLEDVRLETTSTQPRRNGVLYKQKKVSGHAGRRDTLCAATDDFTGERMAVRVLHKKF